VCLIVCDVETSRVRRPRLDWGCSTAEKKTKTFAVGETPCSSLSINKHVQVQGLKWGKRENFATKTSAAMLYHVT
jgi:hypothetical protein